MPLQSRFTRMPGYSRAVPFAEHNKRRFTVEQAELRRSGEVDAIQRVQRKKVKRNSLIEKELV